MSYNTKYVLQYCNSNSDKLRVELQLEGYIGQTFLLVDDDTFVTDNNGDYVVMNIDGSYNPDRDKNPIEGSTNPFSLTYRNDIGEKGGTIRATEANMSFFEDLLFNIDDLATSDETALRCIFYFNDEIEWIGFVVPDFFNVEITENPVIDLTASDRLGILKDVDYEIDYTTIQTRRSDLYIINKILLNTGLNLNVNILCDYQCHQITSAGGSILNNVFVSELRFISDDKVMNCYDILKSILDKYNCLLTQYKGEWWIVNKEQLEIGQGQINKYDSALSLLETKSFSQNEFHFNEIDPGGQRTIIPAGGRNTYKLDVDSYSQYPFNGDWKMLNTDFSLIGWTKRAGTSSLMSTLTPIQYGSNGGLTDSYTSENRHMLIADSIYGGSNSNQWVYQSNWFNLPSLSSKKLDFDLSILGVGKPETYLHVLVILQFDSNTYKYAWSNVSNGNVVFNFQKYSNDSAPFNVLDDNNPNQNSLQLKFDNKYGNITLAVEQEFKFSVSAANGQNQNFNLTNAKMCVRVYPNGINSLSSTAFIQNVIKHIKIDFKRDDQEPKGVVFQSILVDNFTKNTEEKKVLFGDYQSFGQNGYLYPYRKDSLSIHYNSLGSELKDWSTSSDSTLQPLLIHSLRQLTRSYGKAHDELSIGFEMKRIDPLSKFAVKCYSERLVQVGGKFLQDSNGSNITALFSKYLNNKKFILVEGTIDYLRSQFTGKLAQVLTNNVGSTEYIYSDF